MMAIESATREGGWTALRLTGVACIAASVMSCMSLDIEPPAALRGASAAAARAWFDERQRRLSEGADRLRLSIDEAMASAASGARDSANETVRRVRSRAIMASDACYSTEETEGCTIAARSACQRASYADGAPLASSTYFACSGSWGLRAADAPEGACKTKRRLNAALCW